MTTIAYELRRRELPLPSRQTLGRLLALTTTLVFGALFVRHGSLGAAWTAMRSLPLWTVGVALAAIGGGMWFTAVRWRILLGAAGVDVPTGRLFAALAVSAAANNLLPARGGDLVRVAAMRGAAPAPAVVGTMAAERLLDGFTLALWIVFGALLAGAGAPLLPLGIAVAAATGLGIALAALATPASLERTGRILPRRLRGRALAAGAGFLSGLEGLRSPRLLARALAASFALWLCDVVMYGVLAHGFGLPLGLGGWFLLEGIGNLALAVPATAAGIGSFDYLTLLGAHSLGVAGPAAAAYVLAVHALVVLPATILGALLARRAFRPAARRSSPAWVARPEPVDDVREHDAEGEERRDHDVRTRAAAPGSPAVGTAALRTRPPGRGRRDDLRRLPVRRRVAAGAGGDQARLQLAQELGVLGERLGELRLDAAGARRLA
jgi:glycosyltransferase 2 family protein